MSERRYVSDRLHRTESVLNASNETCLAAADWLGGMLHRPPLSHPTPAWEAIRALVEALWWDIEALVPDPASPRLDGEIAGEHIEGIIPMTHPRLFANHPWSEIEEES